MSETFQELIPLLALVDLLRLASSLLFAFVLSLRHAIRIKKWIGSVYVDKIQKKILKIILWEYPIIFSTFNTVY